MIREELLNNGTLVRHYSDSGMCLLQHPTEIVYGEAIDIVPCPYTYEEVEDPDAEEATAEEILNIILGEDTDDN